MDRREALKTLVSLPAIARISVARLQPNDVIVIESDELLTHYAMDTIRAQVEQIWPDRKVIVLDRSLKLKIATS